MAKYIDADKVRYEVVKYFDGLPIQGHYDMLKIIDEEPAADVSEVRHGRWIDDETAYICSVCFHGSPSGAKWNYCPNCGAKMERSKE